MKTAVLLISSLLIVSCSNKTMISEKTSRIISPFLVETTKTDDGQFHKTIMMYNTLSPDNLFDAEYGYISKHYGERGNDWYLISQTLIEENNRIVDVVEIRGKRDFEQQVIFFDVTEVYAENNKTDDIKLTAKHR